MYSGGCLIVQLSILVCVQWGDMIIEWRVSVQFKAIVISWGAIISTVESYYKYTGACSVHLGLS